MARPVAKLKALAGRQVLFVMAADAEYGPHLQRRFSPLVTGVGPVEAGISVASHLARLHGAQTVPDLVVCLGSAGSRSLAQTGIYQAVSVSYRDMDGSAMGFEKGVTPFLDLPATLDLPLRIPGIATATLSTGGTIISGASYDAIDEDMVDMETFSVLRACQNFDVPLIALRGISDGIVEISHIDDWTEYLHVIDEKLADAVDALERAIASGDVAL